MNEKKKQYIYPLNSKFKPSTYYVVEVCFNMNNPIHQEIFFSGFLTSEGYPNGYNILMRSQREIGEVTYMKVLREIDSKIDNNYCMLRDVIKKDYPEELI